MPQTLTAAFDALQAERERTWPPEKLAANARQRRLLVEAFDPAAAVRAGDTVAPFELETAGGPVSLDELTADGPLLLIFFRFAGCPACNIALPVYDRELVPAARALGIRTIGVTPHLQAKGAGEIAARHGLSFAIATDRDNALARRFGLTFLPVEAPRSPPPAGSIAALTGIASGELPQAAIVLIGRDHIVRYADISPDWLRRTEPAEVLAQLDATATERA